jgi:O-antigen/teichoic acid export membrane protein
MAIGVFLTPFIISKLGKEDYGIWLLVSSFAGHYGLLTIGLGSAIKHYVALELGKNRSEEINKVISTSLASYFLLGLFLFGISFVFAEEVQAFLKIDDSSFKELLILFTYSFGLNLINSVFKSIQTAFERFSLLNMLDMFILAVKAFITVILLSKGFKTLGMVYALLVVQALYLIFNIIIHFKVFSLLSIGPRFVSLSTFKSLLSFGVSTFIISIGDMLRFNIDSLVTSYYVNVAAVSVYGVGTALLSYITSIIMNFVNVIAPRLSRLVGSGSRDEMVELLIRSMFVSATLSFGALVMIYLFGFDVINYWVGDEFNQSFDILLIISFGSILGFAQLPVISALYSLNKHKLLGYSSLAEGIINVVLSLIFVQKYGIIGVALGTLIPNLINKVVFQPFLVTRELSLSYVRYLTPLAFPAIASIPYFSARYFYFAHHQMVSSNLLVLLVQMFLVGTSYLLLIYVLLTIFRSPLRFVMYGKRIQALSQLLYHYRLGKKFVKDIKAAANHPNKKQTLIYAGGYPDSTNLGDVALFRAYEFLFPDFNFIHYNEGIFNYFLSKIYRLKFRAILGGGTLINDMSLKEAKESSKLFPEFYVFGTGVAQPSFFGNFSEWKDTMHIWKPILDNSPYVGIRGPLSLSLLQKHNIKSEIFGDPVLALSNPENVGNKTYVKKTIGINIGGSAGRMWGGEVSMSQKFTELVNEIKANGFEVHWFVVWSSDLEITEIVAKNTLTSENIHTIYEDHNEYFAKVRDMSVFAGVKLHSVIMAHCEYVPSIMIEYRPKCSDYMESIGEGINNVRVDQLDSQELTKKIIELDQNRVEHSEVLFKRISEFRENQIRIVNSYIERWKDS